MGVGGRKRFAVFQVKNGTGGNGSAVHPGHALSLRVAFAVIAVNRNHAFRVLFGELIAKPVEGNAADGLARGRDGYFFVFDAEVVVLFILRQEIVLRLVIAPVLDINRRDAATQLNIVKGIIYPFR